MNAAALDSSRWRSRVHDVDEGHDIGEHHRAKDGGNAAEDGDAGLVDQHQHQHEIKKPAEIMYDLLEDQYYSNEG